MNNPVTTCGKCHRPLSDPKSVERGHGPDCWASIQSEAPEHKHPFDTAGESDYTYHVATEGDRHILVIEDFDAGGVSVTNNIEAIVGSICATEELEPQSIDIVYRDSEGIYDGAYTDASGKVHIYALKRFERPRSEAEAIEALRQQAARA